MAPVHIVVQMGRRPLLPLLHARPAAHPDVGGVIGGVLLVAAPYVDALPGARARLPGVGDLAALQQGSTTRSGEALPSRAPAHGCFWDWGTQPCTAHEQPHPGTFLPAPQCRKLLFTWIVTSLES